MAGRSRYVVLISFLIASLVYSAAPAAKGRSAAGKKTATPAGNRTPAQIAAQWMKSMTLHDKVAQLVMMVCYGENPNVRTAEYRKFANLVQNVHIGGLIVNNRVVRGQVQNAEPVAMASFLNQMQRLSPLPLIVGGDFERGASMRVANSVKFPHNMTYAAARDLEASRFEGAETAREARAMGVHWVFAPVADVNNNPDNPIINMRSYGEAPADVAAHVAAYIDGAHSLQSAFERVLVTVKHFPGHGDTATDSHMGLSVIGADRARLEAVELVPFKAAIEHGVDAVMTGHLAVASLEPEQIPASVSKAVITGVLKGELKFNGLVVTDAMDMRGLTKQFPAGEASVRAIEAGTDLLLIPSSAEQAIKGVMDAIASKRLTVKRIEESLQKVLEAKVRLGLHTKRTVDLEKINTVVDSPEAEEKSQAVSDAGVTVVKNEGNLFPVRNTAEACLFVLTESRRSRQGLRLLDHVAATAPELKTTLLDPDLPAVVFDQTLAQVSKECKSVVVAAFASAAEYRGNLALAGGFAPFVDGLVKGPAPVGLISLGNPYLLRNFPGVAAYATTFSTVITAEESAAKAIFGQIPISGHMPVTIPGFAKIGDGIQIPAIRR